MNKAVMEVINENNEDCAFIAVDKDGYYLSAIGGNNYIESSFNIALNGKRAIASTAKPLLYYDAILHGYANIKLMSSPTSFKINNKTYTFKNFGSIYENRLITMEEALAVSDNMYALRMQVLLGLNGVSRTLKAFGIEDKESLNQALGTTEMSLKQLLSFYYAFNYDGLKTSFKAIKKIVINNQTKYINYPEYKQVLNKKACNILKSKLGAMFNTYNLIQKPTGTRIKDKLKIKIKGKSGLDDYNSYMIGFSDDYVLGAWTGFKEMKLLTNVNAKIAPKLMVLNAINSLY
jgi:penicillin-binding protein 2d